MPINYNNSKIYKIITNNSDDIYIGSTCQPLRNRLSKHITNLKLYKNGKGKYMKSFDVIEQGNHDIILIENFSCNDKTDLHRKEREFIDRLDCVNKTKK